MSGLLIEVFRSLLHLVGDLTGHLKHKSAKAILTAGVSVIGAVVAARGIPDISAASGSGDLVKVASAAKKAVASVDQPFAQYLWEQRRNEFEILFGRIAGGTFIVNQHEILPVAIEMLQANRVRKEMVATSSTKGWWDTVSGRNYEDLNFALARQITVKRIFIYDDDAELKALEPIMERQRKNGIEVWHVKRNPSDPDMASDYIILDGSCAGTLILTPERSMVRAEFDFRANQVDTVKRKIGMIKNMAIKL